MLKLSLFVAGAVLACALTIWLTVDKHFRESEVVVPDVRGVSIDDATARLKSAGLTLSIDARRPHESLEAGLVSYQDPIPGAATRRGREVRVTVSTGRVSVTIPDLVGRSRREAALALRNDQLVLRDAVQVHARSPPDTVLAQAPRVGEALDENGDVDLLVSLGSDKVAYVMPDLRGHRAIDVERVLAEAGLRLGDVRREPAPGQAEGTVRSQLPPPGSRVYRDTAVMVVVAGGADMRMAMPAPEAPDPVAEEER